MGRRRPDRSAPNLATGSDVSLPVITVPTTEGGARPRALDDRNEAFDALFRAHYARLVRALTAACGDREAAADAVQEAFARAHVRWRRIRRYDDPVGWVRRVAINRLRDDHRRAGRRQRALDRLGASTTTTVDAAEIDEFDRLLEALPRQQRLTTAFFYVDGLSVAEIADALGIAEGSVKSHLHDARRRLRVVIEAERNDDTREGDDGRPEENGHG